MLCASFSQSFLPAVHSVTRNTSRRFFKPSIRHSATLVIPADTVDSTPVVETSSLSTQNFLRERKLQELQNSLTRSSNPSRVWSYYTSLVDVVGSEQVPLEVHQQVLRQCTASTAELRVSAVRRILAGNKPISPHIHEGRFQAIIRNIRTLDITPSLDDYHFILEQFAAVGHHVGAVYVYKELIHLGLTPRTKTFGLYLQAIAHRLTLPISKEARPQMVAETRKMLVDLMNDMQQFSIPFTSVNLDLTIRILKETLDMEGFESLMKLGYGIDLANPDRPPLEHMGTDTISGDLGITEKSVPNLPAPQPFSTSALNTTIDMLGRLGNVSKLVQAFEVLTVPLPQANQHLFTSFDDDDDFGVTDNLPPTFIPPHASANTTTYNTLLRHLCKAGHAILARHYLLQAMQLDRQTDRRLRLAIKRQPLHIIPAPHFAINRGTFLPVFGESNRDKNIGLMRWLSTKIPRVIRKKKADLEFYQHFRETSSSLTALRLEKERLHSSKTCTPSEGQDSSLQNPSNLNPPSPVLQSNGSAFVSSSLRSLGKTIPVTQQLKWDSLKPSPVFDLDVDAPPSSSSPPMKYLNLDLHIKILERDVTELEAFSGYVENILGRTTQRLKERLGRRVWAGKDIYLLTDHGKRRKVSREHWRDIVQFQPRRVGNHSSQSSPREAASHRNNRGFSTLTQTSGSNQISISNMEFSPPSTNILDPPKASSQSSLN